MNKKYILSFVVTAAIVASIMMYTTACSRDAKEINTVVKTPLNLDTAKPSDVFTLSRNGQSVKIQWHAALANYKSIHVLRNATGVDKNREAVATLDVKALNYVDLVPNAGPFWYWLRIWPQQGHSKFVGPLRVEADEDKTNHYVSTDNLYTLRAERNETTATIYLDHVGDNFKELRIKRSTNSRTNKRVEILATREWTTKLDDVLPDPYADYWYWLEIYLENGAIIYRGPQKADFK